MRRDAVLVAEMDAAAKRLIELLGDRTADSLLQDHMRRDAILWNFTVLGEAAAQVSDDLKAEHPSIPWRQPSQLRNRIVHGYWRVDLDIIAATITDDLPRFLDQLAKFDFTSD